jgi:hypothetical protein
MPILLLDKTANLLTKKQLYEVEPVAITCGMAMQQQQHAAAGQQDSGCLCILLDYSSSTLHVYAL